MGLIRRLTGTILVPALFLSSCASIPPKPREVEEPPTEKVPEVRSPDPLLEAIPSPVAREPGVLLPEVPRIPPVPLVPRTPHEASIPWAVATPLDLDSWPFGWVHDPATSHNLQLADRFWSDQKPRWREALDARSTPAQTVLRLGQIFRNAGSPEEALRSAWLAAQICSASQLREDARRWLEQASSLSSNPVVALERSWDQVFRLHDVNGAVNLWPRDTSSWPDGAWAQKARLLRQRLFSGTRSLKAVGADDYLSTQVLDQDDLWAATWNGAVVRWSLSTDTLDLVLAAGPTVSPVKVLSTTRWFLYAFQDQSLMRYSKVTETWRSFPYPPGWTGLRIQGVVAEGEETLLVAYLGQGLWRWDKGRWSLVDDAGGGPFLNALASDGSGGLWIGTKDRGLWSWRSGLWAPVPASGPPGPADISVIQPDPSGTKWFIGTWGEGTWILENDRLEPWSEVADYVTAATWTEGGPLWGALDVGLVRGKGAARMVLGVSDGIPSGGVSALVSWQDRWIWGTTGQGWGWWSEYENPALFR